MDFERSMVNEFSAVFRKCKSRPRTLRDYNTGKFFEGIRVQARSRRLAARSVIAMGAENTHKRAEMDLTQMCIEMQEMQRKKLNEESRLKQIRDNTEELKDLRQELKNARAIRDFANQLNQVQALRGRRYLEKYHECQQLNEDLCLYDQDMKKKEECETAKRAYLKSIMDEQYAIVAERHKNQAKIREEEKLARIELEKKQKQEDLEASQLKAKERKERRKVMMHYIENHIERMKMEHEKDIAETLAIEALRAEREEKAKREKELKQARADRKRRMAEEIGLRTVAQEIEQRKREDELTELLYFERGMIDEKQEKDRVLKDLERRKSMVEEYREQLEKRRILKEERQNEDAILIRGYLEKAEEDKKKHEEEELQRKRMAANVHRELGEIIRIKSQIQAIDKANEVKFVKQDEIDYNEKLQALKWDMIRQEPIEVLRYLPREKLCTPYLPADLVVPVREHLHQTPFPILINAKKLP